MEGRKAGSETGLNVLFDCSTILPGTVFIQQTQAAAEARVKAEQSKKKGGKGLCKKRYSFLAVVVVVV